jgi:hypothetical protein
MVSSVSVKPAIFDLGEHGKVLATRDLGREIGRQAADQLSGTQAMILGFWGVEVASPPFLDELLRALGTVLWGGGADRLFVAAGFNDDVRESLSMVLERRGGTLGELDHGQVRLLGGKKHLQETLEAAQRLGYFTASQLAEELKVKLPNLHARLKTLSEAGVLARDDEASGRIASKRGGPARVFRTADLQVLQAALADR